MAKKRYYGKKKNGSNKKGKGRFGHDMPKEVMYYDYASQDYLPQSYGDTMEYTDMVHNDSVRKGKKQMNHGNLR